MEIVLREPEIPGNTGNIARLCAANHMKLHLIEPLGFTISDRHLKRAGLDYWHLLDVTLYPNWDDFLEKHAGRRMYFASTKAPHVYSDIQFEEDDLVVFGRESQGLPEELLRAHEEYVIRIPMIEEARSLNLSNAVAIIAYESLRQRGFPGLRTQSDYLHSSVEWGR